MNLHVEVLQLRQRVEALEKRVEELEARPIPARIGRPPKDKHEFRADGVSDGAD